MQAAQRQGVDMSGIDVKHPIDAVGKIALKVRASGNEVLEGCDARRVATEVMDFVIKGIKSKISDAEAARIHYRDHAVRKRESVDAPSTQADKLMKAVRASKTLKEGVKIGAECMALKRSVTEMAGKLTQREKFLDEMQALRKGNGMTLDDRTMDRQAEGTGRDDHRVQPGDDRFERQVDLCPGQHVGSVAQRKLRATWVTGPQQPRRVAVRRAPHGRDPAARRGGPGKRSFDGVEFGIRLCAIRQDGDSAESTHPSKAGARHD